MLVMAILFVCTGIAGGNRANVIAILFLLFYLYVMQKFTLKQMMPLIFLGVLLMLYVGGAREDVLSSFNELTSILPYLFDHGLRWDTAGYAYHQSLCFILLDGITSSSEHVYLAQQWIKSIFFGSTAIQDSQLASIAQMYFISYGGGFLPFHFYYYFGLAGVFACGIATAMYLRLVNNIKDSSSNIHIIAALGVCMTTCRWYLYSPSPLTRGMLLLLVIVASVLFLTKKKSETIERIN